MTSNLNLSWYIKSFQYNFCADIMHNLVICQKFLKIGKSLQRRSLKKTFGKILQNSPENTCAEISFKIKLQASYL